MPSGPSQKPPEPDEQPSNPPSQGMRNRRRSGVTSGSSSAAPPPMVTNATRALPSVDTLLQPTGVSGGSSSRQQSRVPGSSTLGSSAAPGRSLGHGLPVHPQASFRHHSHSNQASPHLTSSAGSSAPSASKRSRYWETVLAAPESGTPASPPGPPPPPPPLPRGGSSSVRQSDAQTTSAATSGPTASASGYRARPAAPHPKSRKLTCPDCGLDFDHRSNLMTHIQLAHNPDQTFPCRFPQCDKIFGHRSSRSRHERAHRWPTDTKKQ